MAKRKSELEIFLNLKGQFGKGLRGATRDLRRFIRQGEQLGRRMARTLIAPIKAITSLKTAVLGTAGAYAAFATGRSILKTAGQFETYRAQLGVLLRDQEKANVVFERFKEIAAASPLDTADFIQAFVQLQAVGVRDAEATVKRLGDVATVFRRKVQDIASVIINPEKEPLGRLGITLDRMGKKAILTSGNIRLAVEKDIESIRAAILDIWTQSLAGAMERMKNTYESKVAEMEGSWKLFKQSLGEPLLPYAKKAIDGITELLNTNRDLAAKIFEDLGQTATVTLEFLRLRGQTIFDNLLDHMAKAVVDIAKTLWDPLVHSFAEVGVRLISAFKLNWLEQFAIDYEYYLGQTQRVRNPDEARKDLSRIRNRIVALREQERKDLAALRKELTRALGPNLRQNTQNVLDLATALKAAGLEYRNFISRAMDRQLPPGIASLQAEMLGLQAVGPAPSAPSAPPIPPAAPGLGTKLLQQFHDALARKHATNLKRAAELTQQLRTQEEKRIDALIELARLRPYLDAATYQRALEQLNAQYDKQIQTLEIVTERQKTFLDGMKESALQLRDDFNDTFRIGADAVTDFAYSAEYALGGFFESAATGSRSVKDAFKDMSRSILQDIQRIASQTLARQILGSLFGGVLGGIGNIFASGPSRPGLTPVGIPNPTRMDQGGIIRGPALVQVGPITEAFAPLTGRHATPLDAPTNVNITINALDAPGVKALLQSPDGQSAIQNVMVEALGTKPTVRNAVRGAMK